MANRNGRVTVEATDGNRLTVSGRRVAASEAGLESVTVAVSTGEATLVDVRLERGEGFENRSVPLTVGVPEGATADAATTANGDVSVTGVGGDVRAATSNGAVEVRDVTGYVRAASGNGDVTARETTGLRGAHTANGAVAVDVLGMRDDVTCSSANGPVTARVGESVRAAVRLTTARGTTSVASALPFEPSVSRPRTVVGRLRGADAPLLTLRSGNGDVTLQPA
ncbi:MAG: hypothetical protein ABEJ42_03450 [Halobacteriaceae archaeon]